MKFSGIFCIAVVFAFAALVSRPAVAAQDADSKAGLSAAKATHLQAAPEPKPPQDKPKKSKKNDDKDDNPDDGNSGGGNDGQTPPPAPPAG
jgi:hypothetical protein